MNLVNLADFKEYVQHLGQHEDQVALRGFYNKELRSFSYRRLVSDVRALAAAFIDKGLQGKHISLVGESSYEWIVTWLSVVTMGSVIVPIDKELTEADMRYIVTDSDSAAIMASNTFLGYFKPEELPKVAYIFSVRDIAKLVEHGNRLLEEGDKRYENVQMEPEELCALVYTSGTTGLAKGVMLSQKNILANILFAPKSVDIDGDSLSVLPIHHTLECSLGILCEMYLGLNITLNNSLKYVADNLKLIKPHNLVLVPLFVETLSKRVWDEAQKSGKAKLLKTMLKVSNALRKIGIDLRKPLFKSVREGFGGNLKLIVCGGAPIAPALVKEFCDFGITVVTGYGTTECAPLIAVNPNRKLTYDSVGFAMKCCEIKIDDPTAEGEGEIMVRGNNVMLGYYKKPEVTAEVFRGEWFLTGDIGKIDKKGRLHITGRKKNIIVLNSGKNVYPEELEFLLEKEPLVGEVIVRGVVENGQETQIQAEIFPSVDYAAANDITDLEAALNAIIAKTNVELPLYKKIGSLKLRDTEFAKTTTKKIKRS